jgi:hypothetical protein
VAGHPKVSLREKRFLGPSMFYLPFSHDQPRYRQVMFTSGLDKGKWRDITVPTRVSRVVLMAPTLLILTLNS